MIRIPDWRNTLGLYIFATLVCIALGYASSPMGESGSAFLPNILSQTWENLFPSLSFVWFAVWNPYLLLMPSLFTVYAVASGIQLYALVMIAFALVGPFAATKWPKLAPWLARPQEGSLDGLKLRRFSWGTPVMMTLAVTATCAFVSTLVTKDARNPLPVHYAVNVGLLLSVLGMMSGAYFSSAAKQTMGTDFGVQYLPADHWLSQRVHRLAQQLNFPTPAVGITGVTNAFAMGSSPKDAAVVIGTPLIKQLSHEELDAVIGHELGHVVSGDMRQMQFAVGFQRMFGYVFSFLAIVGTITAAAAAKTRSSAQMSGVLGDALHKLGSHIIFFGSDLAVKRLSRQREFVADAIGAGLTTPDAMAGALRKLHRAPAPSKGAENNYGYFMFRGSRLGLLLATHPTLENRLKALEDRRVLSQLPRK
jgi:heat shock protein HtpX